MLGGLCGALACSPDTASMGATAASGSGPSEAGTAGTGAGNASVAGSSGAAAAAGGAPGNGGGGAAVGGSVGAASGQQVLVKAGALDRDHSVVTFALPAASASRLNLRAPGGELVPLQVGRDGQASFILASLAAGQEATFGIEAAAAPASGVTATQAGNVVAMSQGAQPIAAFQGAAELPGGVAAVYSRGGYLHPLYSPSGVTLTGDYPPSHIHHHGVWSAWTKTQYGGHAVDFWNMGDGLGKVEFDSLESTWQGPVHGGISAKLSHIDLTGQAPLKVLGESWLLQAYKTHESAAPYRLLDLHSLQENVSAQPLILEPYTYGGFGFRGREEWLDKTKVQFLTSEGFDRLAGDDTNARWCAIAGTIDDKITGFAVLGHPENFRAPQPVRIHPDEPYFSFSPIKKLASSIEPGATYRTRFRIVTFDGAPDAKTLDALWQDYADPAAAEVVPAAP